MSTVRRLSEEVCSWTAEDWELFDAPPARLKLDAKASDAKGGVEIEFSGWGGQGRDGGIEIVIDDSPTILAPNRKRLVFTTIGSRRAAAEDVIFKLVLDELRIGVLKDVCLLAPGFYPPSVRTARLAFAVENRRLRKQLRELRRDTR